MFIMKNIQALTVKQTFKDDTNITGSLVSAYNYSPQEPTKPPTTEHLCHCRTFSYFKAELGMTTEVVSEASSLYFTRQLKLFYFDNILQ